MTWKQLKMTWITLTEIINLYKENSPAFRNLVETKRLIEVEMREQGFEKEWLELTQN